MTVMAALCCLKISTIPAVIVRLDRKIQYSGAIAMESKSCGVLDAPQEPVIGLAEGEARWRDMTA
jgi:hypothetical protein